MQILSLFVITLLLLLTSLAHTQEDYESMFYMSNMFEEPNKEYQHQPLEEYHFEQEEPINDRDHGQGGIYENGSDLYYMLSVQWPGTVCKVLRGNCRVPPHIESFQYVNSYYYS
jgi:hypothetical protein